jgi:hypothetical protein
LTQKNNNEQHKISIGGGVDLSSLIFNTITLMATALLTTVDRFIPLPCTFNTGYYFTLGGTADLTFIYR